jgi:peroxiredoxin
MKQLTILAETNYKLTLQSVIFVVALLGMNVFLAQQNKKLQVLASRPDRALEVKTGTPLPALEGLDSSGQPLTLGYGQDSRKTLLFVLSTRCRACLENMAAWRAMIDQLDSRRYRLAGISLQSNGLSEFANRHGINTIPIFAELDPKYRVTYNLALTPQIILIDAAGKAEKVWTGALRNEETLDLEKTLGIQLP